MRQKKNDGNGGAKERIRDAAVELFSQKGYTRTTTSAIAKRAGVNELTLFRIFGNKKALLHDVFFQLTPVAEHANLKGLSGGEDIGNDLAVFFDNCIVLHIKHMPAYRLSLQLQEEIYDRDIYYASFARIRGIIDLFTEYLKGLGEKGKIAAIDYHAFVECMFGLFLTKSMEFSLSGQNHAERDEAAITEFVQTYSRDMAAILAAD